MNDDFDNAKTDLAAWDSLVSAGSAGLGAPLLEDADPATGEVLDLDAPDNGGWDKERHCATNLRGADWAAGKLREAQEQMAFNGEQAVNECLRIDEEARRKREAVWERLRRANAPFQRSAEFFRNAVVAFAQTHREEVLKGLREKSRLLPSGVRIGWEKEGGHLRLAPQPDARETLIAWARVNQPDLTEERWEVDVQAVKKRWGKAAGAPPGLERVPESEELHISTGVDVPVTKKSEEP